MMQKLVLSLIACAAFGAQTGSPPVISLNLEESVQKLATVQGHTCGGRVFPTAGTAFDSKPCESSTALPSQQGQINHKSSKAVKVTTQSAGEAYGKACNVLTDSAKTCAEPTATAYDHHESEVDVVKTVMLYIASWPKFDPVQVFQAVEQVDYEQRGEYILYYDAADSSGNNAEQLAFGMIMQDHVAPTLTTDLDATKAVELEACFPNQPNMADRTHYELPRTSKTSATDLYDGDVSETVEASSRHCAKVMGCSEADFGAKTAGWKIDTYKLGTHKITVEARDYANIFGQGGDDNTVSSTFTVKVTDTMAPKLFCKPATDANEDPIYRQKKGALTTGMISSEIVTPELLVSHGIISHVDHSADASGAQFAAKACAKECIYQQLSNPLKAPCAFFQVANVAGKFQCSLFTVNAKAQFNAGSDGVNLIGELVQCQESNTIHCRRPLSVRCTSSSDCGSAYKCSPQGMCVESKPYQDAGAWCIDMRDSFRVAAVDANALKVAVSGATTIDYSAVGTHQIKYQCADSQGFAAKEIVRAVTVVDHRAPELTMEGDHHLQLEMYQQTSADVVFEFLRTNSNVVSCADECDASPTIRAQLFDTDCAGVYLSDENVSGKWGQVDGGDREEFSVGHLDRSEFGAFFQQLGHDQVAIKYTCTDKGHNAVSKCRKLRLAKPGTCLFKLTNTHPRYFWLPNFLETLLVQVWYPTTVAGQPLPPLQGPADAHPAGRRRGAQHGGRGPGRLGGGPALGQLQPALRLLHDGLRPSHRHRPLRPVLPAHPRALRDRKSVV